LKHGAAAQNGDRGRSENNSERDLLLHAAMVSTASDLFK
jgi:hypothetical protein